MQKHGAGAELGITHGFFGHTGADSHYKAGGAIISAMLLSCYEAEGLSFFLLTLESNYPLLSAHCTTSGYCVQVLDPSIQDRH